MEARLRDTDLPTYWSGPQMRLFHKVYHIMTEASQAFLPPGQVVPHNLWHTIAWNAAWTAAEELPTALPEPAVHF